MADKSKGLILQVHPFVEAYFKKGLYNSKLHHTLKAFYNYSLSKRFYLALNDSNQVAGKLLNMANIQKNIGDYGSAKETVIEALKYQKNRTNNKHLSKLYNTLSVVKKEEKNFLNNSQFKLKVYYSTLNSCHT